eukprot:7043520-Prymnesium_polylepis.1
MADAGHYTARPRAAPPLAHHSVRPRDLRHVRTSRASFQLPSCFVALQTKVFARWSMLPVNVSTIACRID